MPLVYLPLEDGTVVVAGSNAFSPDHDPGWLHNLRAKPRVDVQIREKVSPYLAVVLPTVEQTTFGRTTWRRILTSATTSGARHAGSR